MFAVLAGRAAVDWPWNPSIRAGPQASISATHDKGAMAEPRRVGNAIGPFYYVPNRAGWMRSPHGTRLACGRHCPVEYESAILPGDSIASCSGTRVLDYHGGIRHGRAVGVQNCSARWLARCGEHAIHPQFMALQPNAPRAGDPLQARPNRPGRYRPRTPLLAVPGDRAADMGSTACQIPRRCARCWRG